MTQRRRTGPAGRGARRAPRATRTRPETSDTTQSARTPAGRRTTRRRGVRSGAASAPPARNRLDGTIFGLSTGRAVILAAVLCALALTLAVPTRTYLGQRSEAAQLARQRVQLSQDVAQLRDRRAQQQDPAYVRSEARSRLRLVMPGDTAYIVQVPGMQRPPIPVPPPPPQPKDPWYAQLWRSMSTPPPLPPDEPPPPPPAPGPQGAPR